MDRLLFNAACSGDVHILRQLLQQNPFLLYDTALIHSLENPLTVAIKANQTVFAREILKLNPQLSIELNQDGIRPLDVASSYGNVEIVRGILALEPGALALEPGAACRLPGKDGRTAIHYAAMNGRVEIIGELLSASPDSLRDATVYGETALHFAVKCFKFEALRSMLQWIEKLQMMEMVNWEDKDGNTILHYAASRKQLECIEILIEWNKKSGEKLEANIVNKKGLTAMDIVDMLSDYSTDITLRNIMLRSGAYAASELENIVIERPQPSNNHAASTKSHARETQNFQAILKYFQFQRHRDSPAQARETLLVVVALLATVTLHAGINPPTFLFHSTPHENVDDDLSSFLYVQITVFLVANSISLATLLRIIDYLIDGLPFQRDLRVSMYFLMFAYGWSMGSTRPTGAIKTVLLALALIVPTFIRSVPNCLSKKSESHAGVAQNLDKISPHQGAVCGNI